MRPLLYSGLPRVAGLEGMYINMVQRDVYFKIELNVSAAVTALLVGVGALLMQRRTA